MVYYIGNENAMLYYTGYADCFVEREENMSFLIGSVNNEGVMIISDSRLTTDGKVNDSFIKVFKNHEKQRIWGIVGYYGKNLKLFNKLNEYLNEAYEIDEEELKKILMNYISDIESKTVNIFVGELTPEPQLNVYDYIDGNFHVSKGITNSMFFAGSNPVIKDKLKKRKNEYHTFDEMLCSNINIMSSIIQIERNMEMLDGSKSYIGGSPVYETLRK